jgi:hypothetical protein
MVSIGSLWIPIVLSALVVFLASSILHMVLPFHRSDYRKLAAEDEVMNALRPFNIAPGDYMIPCGTGPASMRDAAFLDKMKKGPVAVVTFMRPGSFAMGKPLAQWFVYTLVVSVFAAYITGHALGPGAPYLEVFRFVGATTFVGYALALWQNSIWYSKAWGTTLRSTLDGLVYALLSAGVFGWLWPR